MKIILSIKAFLNYLYNHLIDLIWVKTIRFEDGTEMSSLPVGANLYDIKKLSQAIIDKGWTYLCNSTKQMLSKTNIPTVYNDIEEKYFNVDKEFTGDFSNLVGTSNQFSIAFDDDYIYTTTDTTWVLKKTLISALPNTNWVNVGLVNRVATATQRFTVASGKNLLIALEYVDNNNSIFRIYNKSNMQVLKTYNNAGIGSGNRELPFVKLYKIKGKDVFILSYKIETNRCGIVFIDDNTTLNIVEKEFPYHSIGIPAYAGGDTFFFMSKDITDNQHNYQAVFKTTDKFSTWTKKYTYKATLNYDYDLKTCFCIGNNISISRASYVSTDFGETWSELPSGDNRTRAGKIMENSYFDGTILFGVTNDNSFKKLIVTTDLLNYSIALDCNYAYNGILLSRDKSKFVAHRSGNYNLDIVDWTKIVYTDNYTIGGVTVAVQYYKFNDWKICISDGGANDTNLDTVYNSLGYANYWLLDRVNQQLCLPRINNLYTQMYVGDDYNDITVPTGIWCAVALKNELGSGGGVTSGNVITAYAIDNFINATKGTVYLTDRPTVINFGSSVTQASKYWNLQVSTDNVNWKTISGYKVMAGDPDSTSVYSVVIGGNVYWKVESDVASENLILRYCPVDSTATDLSMYKLKSQEIVINDTSITIDNILPNKNYVFSSNAITDITLTACVTSFEETTIEFSTGGSAPTLTDNTGIVWVDGSAPTLNANKNYLIVIFNNKGFVKEY